MAGRYIGLFGSRAARRGAVARIGALGAIHLLQDDERLTLFADAVLPHCALGGGALLGRLFLRGQTQPCAMLDEGKQAACIASRGEFLTDTCWGSYIAVLPDPDGATWHVLRAPFGMLPCLWAEQDGLTWIGSDLPLLEQAGLRRPAIDWDALALHLVQPELRHSRTCLSGITDLSGGHRLTLALAGASTTGLWSPWPFARQEEVAPEEAPTRLRGAVNLAVAAMSATDTRSILLLSGGLDSSIAAASLARAGRSFDCLTFKSDGAGGDESHYARAVADHLGLRWHELRPNPDRIDPQYSAAAHLPRPNERLFYQEYDRIAVALARDVGAGAILHGGGGDNVFYGHPSVAPVAQCLLEGNGRFRTSAAALADLTGSSQWRVMAIALRRALRKSRPIDRDSLRLRFLAPRKDWPERLHAWEDPPEDILPGKASHAALLAATLKLAEAADPLREIPAVPVFLAQPLVEACLVMPTDQWFAPGQNRAIARRAFARDLPESVIARHSKGTPDAFVATIFEQRKAEIRTLLLDGLLASQRLLNRPLLAAVLDDPAPARGYDFARVLELVDAEAWARSRV